MKDKKVLRQEIKARLAAMKVEEREEKTKQIHHSLFCLQEWKEARIVGVTISIANEIDTFLIIQRAWDEGKQVAAPKCLPETKELTFHLLTSYSELEDSFYGLKEPNPEKTKTISGGKIDFLLVPGLLYDRSGYRIGYGGGYYDRFLAKAKPFTCVLAYSQQLMSQPLPHEDFDIPVDRIITEQEVIVV